MRIFTILLMAAILFPNLLSSKEVDVRDAKNVAKNFFYKSAKHNASKGYESLKLSLNHVESEGENLFYVFNIEGQEGFVITSAQDFTKPILGYSDQNKIDFSNLSPELDYMLEGYRQQIRYGIKNKIVPSVKVAEMWQGLRIVSQNKNSVSDAVGPLLLTTWNQAPYYNDLCPKNSDGKPAVVGCVATAMAQVMKYYDYPEQGQGSHSQYDSHGSVTHYSNINYSEQTYDWTAMPINLTGPNDELAKLMYHCGQSVNMNWEVEGSGAYSVDVVDALKSYFKYSSTVTFKSKNYYSDASWENILKTELDALRPIFYAGTSSEGGHAWNCDGYQSTDVGIKFHMNYGWGGSGNGYFTLDDLYAGVLPDGGADYFNTGHRVIIGIKPSNNYPMHCSSDVRLIQGKEGVFGDGSGNQNYQENLDCRTLIQPDCNIGSVTLAFNNFDLAEGDVVTLYEGDNINSPIIAQFDMSNQPEGDYSSYRRAMLIRFETDGSESARGWNLSYTTKACGSTDITDAEGKFSDGSGICEYQPGTRCKWFIKAPNATQVIINFTEFDLDVPSHDYIKIYKNSISSANLVATYKSDAPPTGPLVVDAPIAVVRFNAYSLEDNVGDGWKISYSTDCVGINKVDNIQDKVKVYPNPFSGNAIVNIENPDNQLLSVTLTNVLGQVIAHKDYVNNDGSLLLELSDITNKKIESGVYFLNVIIGNQKATYKLISE